MNKQKITLGFIIGALIILLFFGGKMFKTLQPAESGVVFKPFTGGLKKDKILEPGFHIIAPWNKLIVYDVTEQQSEERMDVLDKSGLSLQIDVTVRYKPMNEKIGYIHEKFMGKYIDRVVKPELRSSVRKVTGRYTAEEIYSTKRTLVEEQIINETKKVFEDNYIEMQALLIRSITLPNEIKNAIESKLKQEQEALAYRFRLDKELSEAERRRIEAEGIAAYNKIISASITDNILTQKGIDATLELSKSPNTKIIIVGGGENGLPLILNSEK